MQHPRIPSLDGWRAVSIALVTFGHLSDPQHLPWLGLFANGSGAFGVSIFFAISGYLITTLLLNELADDNSIDLGQFYIRRSFRILPPAMAYLAFSLIFAPWQEVLKCLFFLAGYSDLTSPYLGHFWSLSIEEHFYMLWPFLLAYLGARRSVVAGSVLFCLITVWRILIHPYVEPGYLLLHRTDGRLDAFFAPCVLAILIHRKQIRMPAWVPPLALAVTLISFAVTRNNMIASDLQKSLQSILLAVLVVGTSTNKESLLTQFLDLAPLRFFGRISYSLYLWQPLVNWPFPRPVILGLMILFAWCSYRWIEQPAIRLGRRVAARMSDSTVPAVT